MITPHDRGSFLQELLVAEVLARRGEGPLARKRWPRPRPRDRSATHDVGTERAPVPPHDRDTPEPER